MTARALWLALYALCCLAEMLAIKAKEHAQSKSFPEPDPENDEEPASPAPATR